MTKPAEELWLFSTQPGRNRHVQIQDHHWTAPDSPQSTDRGEDWLQRPEPHDQPWHAGLHPGQVKQAATGKYSRKPNHAPTLVGGSFASIRGRMAGALGSSHGLPKASTSSRTTGGRICHPSSLAVAHLNLKLSRLSCSTNLQPISFMSRSISALIPFPDQNDFRMYGNDVMDFTSVGSCSM